MIEYKDYLYAGTVNSATGTEVWRSSNGTQWNLVIKGGFNDLHNSSVWSGAIFEGNLFLGTLNNKGWLVPADGTQIWKDVDGLHFLPLVTR